MKYSMTRKINLGKYGLQFESVDIGVSDCDSREDALKEIQEWKDELVSKLKPQEYKNQLDEPDIQVDTKTLKY